MNRDDDVLRDETPNRYFDPHFKVAPRACAIATRASAA